MSNDEKYQLLLDASKAVELMAGRIVKMAHATSTFIRQEDSEFESKAMDNALLVLHPYLFSLFDSEEGLGDPGKDREWIWSVMERIPVQF